MDDKSKDDKPKQEYRGPKVVSEVPDKEPGLENVPLLESFIAPASTYRKVAQKLMSGGRAMVGKKFAKGGKVSGASGRADGIAQRGKTRGRIV